MTDCIGTDVIDVTVESEDLPQLLTTIDACVVPARLTPDPELDALLADWNAAVEYADKCVTRFKRSWKETALALRDLKEQWNEQIRESEGAKFGNRRMTLWQWMHARFHMPPQTMREMLQALRVYEKMKPEMKRRKEKEDGAVNSTPRLILEQADSILEQSDVNIAAFDRLDQEDVAWILIEAAEFGLTRLTQGQARLYVSRKLAQRGYLRTNFPVEVVQRRISELTVECKKFREHYPIGNTTTADVAIMKREFEVLLEDAKSAGKAIEQFHNHIATLQSIREVEATDSDTASGPDTVGRE